MKYGYGDGIRKRDSTVCIPTSTLMEKHAFVESNEPEAIVQELNQRTPLIHFLALLGILAEEL